MNAIDTQLCDLMNSGLVQWPLPGLMETVAESGKEWTFIRKHQIQPRYGE